MNSPANILCITRNRGEQREQQDTGGAVRAVYKMRGSRDPFQVENCDIFLPLNRQDLLLDEAPEHRINQEKRKTGMGDEPTTNWPVILLI